MVAFELKTKQDIQDFASSAAVAAVTLRPAS